MESSPIKEFEIVVAQMLSFVIHKKWFLYGKQITSVVSIDPYSSLLMDSSFEWTKKLLEYK